MKKNYYIVSFLEATPTYNIVSEAIWNTFMGQGDISENARKVYYGEMTLTEVSKDIRSAVSDLVDLRRSTFGIPYETDKPFYRIFVDQKDSFVEISEL
jgi:hypothetical protein